MAIYCLILSLTMLVVRPIQSFSLVAPQSQQQRQSPQSIRTTTIIQQQQQQKQKQQQRQRQQCRHSLESAASDHDCHPRRRQFLSSVVAGASTIMSVSASASASAVASSSPPPVLLPKVTDRVFFNVRISRQDGTFYERDDLPTDTDNDKVFHGRLVFELFGDAAPVTVERFKSYVSGTSTTKGNVVNDNYNDDNPLPSYSRSIFSSLDPATGVLGAGKIAGLELTQIGGSNALQYGGRLLPASLWLETTNNKNKKTQGTTSTSTSTTSNNMQMRHLGKGLLTHKILEPLPIFGITTRTDTTQLDATHVVFGRLVVLEDTSNNPGTAAGTASDDGRQFLKIVSNLPTYSELSRPVLPTDVEASSLLSTTSTIDVVDDAAAAIFQAQRYFFRSAAKSFGDSRIEKVYEGKLLRRVEVTQVGSL
eukprot:CAMPEP_0198147160 /NCGR_PEP_ID=MMETSP1443-20131203/33508_1 /TAXON_ID=186043 /ORGANISM="Entomoneis sp., Strain CCMP2396" /LENGTH=421 /DNA_ID=CAMNT_0043811345 /DNA_START=162 /DNA_END=1427 /DNA_ORIENTATION=+